VTSDIFGLNNVHAVIVLVVVVAIIKIIIIITVFPRGIVCLRNISINTLHKGDDDDDDNK